MKQPNPDRLVVTEGIPITVHSAVEGGRRGRERREKEGGREGEGYERKRDDGGREREKEHSR